MFYCFVTSCEKNHDQRILVEKNLPFNLSGEDIDLLKNQVINDSVQTWKNCVEDIG